MKYKILLSALVVAGWLVACGGTDDPGCVSGKVESCPCIGGTQGVQVCLENETWGACDCGEENPDGGVDGDVEADADAGADPDADAEPDADLPPGACTAEEDCAVPMACVGGGCVAPVSDLQDYVTAASARCTSWVWTIQLPAFFPGGERCCFDYNENGVPDDAYGSLLELMGSMQGGALSPEDMLQESVQSFAQLLVLDWVMLPQTGDGDVRISVFTGAPNADGSAGTADPDQWKTGLGTAFLNPVSFGTHGALWQVNQARILDHVVAGAGGPMRLLLPGIFGDGLQPTDLYDVRLQVTLPADPPACRGAFSEDTLVVVDGGGDFMAGGMILGGLIRFDDAMSSLDSALRTCACAGVDPDQPVVVWEVTAERLNASCNEANLPDDGSTCTELDDPICLSAQERCNYMGIMPQFFDVDLDGDGVDEAMSVGLRLGFSGVALGGLMN
ncbi:MAG: hypothetical protein CVU65_10655 [Deltaproteobacteria bacterium HGW-Deltaproteobacteria-22]|nr:MAG: hypothetical protein CVU65_10655 [Deltaproteobacteria bacterium HGW-Deltaproteobacteria-22]